MSDEEPKDPSIFPKRLKCGLTKTEIAVKSVQLRGLLKTTREAKADRDMAIARWKEEKAGLDSRVSQCETDSDTLLDQIESGYAMRDVLVKWIPNHETKEDELHRLDMKVGNPDRIVDRKPMDLLTAMESTPEATDEAQALADAASAIIKPKKAKAERKAKPEPKVKTSGKGKKGKAAVPGADMEGVEDLPALVGSEPTRDAIL